MIRLFPNISPTNIVKIALVGFACLITLYFYIRFSWDKSTIFYWQLMISRIGLICFTALTIYWLYKHRSDYIKEEGSVINLSIFRIVFFSFFVILTPFFLPSFIEQTSVIAALHPDAMNQFYGMNWLVKILPITSELVTSFSLLMVLSAFLAMIGFRTRLAILTFVLSSFYLFFVGNLAGKINHNHHIVWFACILLFSRCSDRHSIDNYLHLRKYGKPILLGKRQDYHIPFKAIWILMGIIYFFPGFWKLWTSGLDWALTENVKYHMYWKWLSIGDWTPIFRIDNFPVLYKISGLFTILFELSFIWLIVKPSTRKYALIAGIAFHIGTFLFMKIFFLFLVLSYISFIDWERLFKRKATNLSYLNTQQSKNRMMLITALILISFNTIFGALKKDSWPFTVYPVFDTIVADHTEVLVYSTNDDDFNSSQLNTDEVQSSYGSERYRAMEQSIINAFHNNDLDEKMQLINELSSRLDYSQHSDSIHVFLAKVSIEPSSNHIIDRKLITSVGTKHLSIKHSQ